MKKVIGFLVVMLLTAGPAMAAEIVVGNYDLLPNTPGQEIEIYVTAAPTDPLIGAANFNVQIADGGPEAGGAIDGPTITAVSLVRPGTIFGDIINDGHSGSGSVVPQVYVEQTATGSGQGPIAADGQLAVVTIDTTGFTSGVFDFMLGDTLNGDTDLRDDTPGVNPIPLTITNGTITIIPEPSTIVMLLGLLAAAAVYMRKRK
jgi:hypothetical protein